MEQHCLKHLSHWQFTMVSISKAKSQVNFRMLMPGTRKKQRRNMFYHKQGFNVKSDLDADIRSICVTIGRIEEHIK